MAKAQCWSNNQVKQAAAELAEMRLAVKEATNWRDSLTSAWRQHGRPLLDKIPESARNPLLYAGVGAAGGGLLGGLSSLGRPKEERQTLRSAVTGALAGGLGGAGLGLLQDHGAPLLPKGRPAAKPLPKPTPEQLAELDRIAAQQQTRPGGVDGSTPPFDVSGLTPAQQEAAREYSQNLIAADNAPPLGQVAAGGAVGGAIGGFAGPDLLRHPLQRGAAGADVADFKGRPAETTIRDLKGGVYTRNQLRDAMRDARPPITGTFSDRELYRRQPSSVLPNMSRNQVRQLAKRPRFSPKGSLGGALVGGGVPLLLDYLQGE